MDASTKLAISYTIFASIATAANLGAQDLLIRAYSGTYGISTSIIAGTATGLIVKYLLDKRYIFRLKTQNVAHDAQTFALYTCMGLITTLFFWGFELSFHYLFATREMRYLGAIIGLAIGYLIKYHLDKRYVFNIEA